MRQWVHEQIAEKQYLKSVNTDDDQNYSDLMKLMVIILIFIFNIIYLFNYTFNLIIKVYM